MNAMNPAPSSRKPRSKFALLPPEDQKRVIDLCNQHSYDEALEIIARPRPECLQLRSSHGALVRFYTRYNEHARKTHLLGQCARSVQLTRQAHSGALRGAILTMLESRIFEALRRDVPVDKLTTEFAILKDFHKGFLSEEKWRTEKNSPSTCDWQLHLSACGNPQKPDFVPIDQHGNPTEPEPLTQSDLAAISEFDPDFEKNALAELDRTIATRGREAAHTIACVYGFSYSFVQERIAAYKEQLRKRGVSAAEAALEIGAALPDSGDPHPGLQQNLTPAQSRKIARRKAVHDVLAGFEKSAAVAQQILSAAHDHQKRDSSASVHSQPPASPNGPLQST